MFDSSSLAENGFASTLSPLALAGIYLTNALAIVLTLGLARPWAAVRLARYRAANLTLYASGDLDAFVAGEKDRVGAAGEEIGEVMDVDIGL